MEKFNNIEEFEQLLQDKLNTHSVSAPSDVWANVASSVGSKVSVFSQLSTYLSSFTNILKVALFVGGIATVVAVLVAENVEKPEVIQEQTEETVSNENNNTESILLENEEASNKNIASETSVQNIKTAKKETVSAQKNEAKPDLPNNLKEQKLPEIQPEAAKQTNEKGAKNIGTSLLISNRTPCLNEVITLSNSSQLLGSWTVNGKSIAENQAQIDYKCDKIGTFSISLKSKKVSEQSTITVNNFATKINTSKGETGVYNFSLVNKTILANWYKNNKLISTNTNTIKVILNNVGQYEIKALPINNSCALAAITEVNIEQKGKFEFYTAFTPGIDGINDNYKVTIENYKSFFIQIFSAKNKKVFETNDPNLGWNGREFNNGIECKTGEYIAKVAYQLNGEEAKTQNIKLTLLR